MTCSAYHQPSLLVSSRQTFACNITRNFRVKKDKVRHKSFPMIRRGLIHSLAARLSRAKKLREWCRFNLLEVELPNAKRKSSKNGHSRRKESSKKVNGIIRNHTVVDKFFEDLGFPPLRKNHSLERQWAAQLDAVRREEKRQTPKKRRRRSPSPSKG